MKGKANEHAMVNKHDVPVISVVPKATMELINQLKGMIPSEIFGDIYKGEENEPIRAWLYTNQVQTKFKELQLIDYCVNGKNVIVEEQEAHYVIKLKDGHSFMFKSMDGLPEVSHSNIKHLPYERAFDEKTANQLKAMFGGELEEIKYYG